jgi:putative inorganic carbon (hco3(-)) transporter
VNATLPVRTLYGIAALLLALQVWLISLEWFWYLLLPFVLLVLVWLFFSIDKFFLVATFAAPLSIELDVGGMNLGLSLPCEPMLLALTMMFWLKLLVEKVDGRCYWRHPLVWVTLVHVGWMAVSTFFSELPEVSLKFLATRIWFTSSMFFLGIFVFRKNMNIHRFLWMYLLPLSGVVVYTLIRHAGYQFEKQPAHWVMDPFFQDHTHYGAMLAMFFPFILTAVWAYKTSPFLRMCMLVVLGIMAVGLLMSISRAAWLSIIGAAGVFLLMWLRIRWYVVAGGVASLVGMFFLFQTEIIMELEKTKDVSSGEFVEHFRSATNIRSDASNTERLLRWNAALRMFKERPVTGFGPGTYQFCYAPYQRSYELTIISTNFGDGGNAHSEYLGPLAEQGLPGMLSFISLGVVALIIGARIVYHPLLEASERWLAYTILLGLVTYFLHGFLNNFLNTDEASVPFWGFMAILTAMDLQLKQRQLAHEHGSTGIG